MEDISYNIDKKLHSWRCILYALFLFAFNECAQVRGKNRKNLANHGLYHSRLNFSMFKNLFTSTLVPGLLPEKPSFNLNLVNFTIDLNNYKGTNFLSFFEFVRNFREHYDKLRNEQNRLAERHLPTNLKISEIFKLFNFLPRAYPFLLCLMKLICPKNHDIHLLINECNLTEEEYTDLYTDEDKFFEFIKAIFVVLFKLKRPGALKMAGPGRSWPVLAGLGRSWPVLAGPPNFFFSKRRAPHPQEISIT